MSRMEKAQLDAFLQQSRIAQFVTLRADGSATTVPVWYEWDGSEARIFTSRGTAKLRNIEGDPRVALAVAEPVGAMEAWVTIEGTATVEEGGIELARRLIVSYYSAERAGEVLPMWEDAAETFVVVRITPVRIESMG
jgi:PPOX class probable F420-dependent enzyme